MGARITVLCEFCFSSLSLSLSSSTPFLLSLPSLPFLPFLPSILPLFLEIITSLIFSFLILLLLLLPSPSSSASSFPFFSPFRSVFFSLAAPPPRVPLRLSVPSLGSSSFLNVYLVHHVIFPFFFCFSCVFHVSLFEILAARSPPAPLAFLFPFLCQSVLFSGAEVCLYHWCHLLSMSVSSTDDRELIQWNPFPIIDLRTSAQSLTSCSAYEVQEEGCVTPNFSTWFPSGRRPVSPFYLIAAIFVQRGSSLSMDASRVRGSRVAPPDREATVVLNVRHAVITADFPDLLRWGAVDILGHSCALG